MSKQEQSVESHSHSFTPEGTVDSSASLYSGLLYGYEDYVLALGRGDGNNTVVGGYNESSSKGYVSQNTAKKKFVSVTSDFTGTQSDTASYGDEENRPANFTMRIWKRTV